MDDHVCMMKEDVQEMTGGVKGLTIDMALIKRDVGDLKTATITMSACIKTLTEASIISQQKNITRDKFYEKLEELSSLRAQALFESTNRIEIARKEVDVRIETIEKDVALFKQSADQLIELRKWVMGLVGAVILFALFEGYRLLVK